MQAIIYVCHGSRSKESANQAKSFIEKVKKEVPISIQEIAFLEYCKPSILDAFDECVTKGATKITIIPVLLLTAAHAKIDIPIEIEKAKKKYAQVPVFYGKPIGIKTKMIDLLINQLNEDITPDSYVLFVGRGSSDLKQVQDFETINRLLMKKLDIKNIESCYLTVSEPNLEQKLEVVMNSGIKKIIILPYILFSGFLTKKIERIVCEKNINDKEIKICRPLSTNPLLIEILQEIILQELLIYKVKPQSEGVLIPL